MAISVPAGIPSDVNPAVGEIPLLSDTRSNGSWPLFALAFDPGGTTCEEQPVNQARISPTMPSDTIRRHLFITASLSRFAVSRKSHGRCHPFNSMNQAFSLVKFDRECRFCPEADPSLNQEFLLTRRCALE